MDCSVKLVSILVFAVIAGSHHYYNSSVVGCPNRFTYGIVLIRIDRRCSQAQVHHLDVVCIAVAYAPVYCIDNVGRITCAGTVQDLYIDDGCARRHARVSPWSYMVRATRDGRNVRSVSVIVGSVSKSAGVDINRNEADAAVTYFVVRGIDSRVQYGDADARSVQARNAGNQVPYLGSAAGILQVAKYGYRPILTYESEIIPPCQGLDGVQRQLGRNPIDYTVGIFDRAPRGQYRGAVLRARFAGRGNYYVAKAPRVSSIVKLFKEIGRYLTPPSILAD